MFHNHDPTMSHGATSDLAHAVKKVSGGAKDMALGVAT